MKDSDNIGLNPYIVQYDKINYDTHRLEKEHTRVKRTLDKNLFLNF